jgi:hypothetical protein
VALITTGTITNLTATGASVASANVGVALVTTGTVTNLTATSASVASANLGTAVITTGNLGFTGTAQRITGDFSNATASNRVVFQSNITNGVTQLCAAPNGTGTQSGLFCFDNSDLANNAWAAIRVVASTDARIQSSITGTGSYLPMTFYTGGSEKVRIDTSGNVGIGGTATAATRVEITGTGPSSGGITRGFRANATIPSATTSAAANFASSATTEAASFTLATFIGFSANGINIGAGSTVTNQYGFIANDNLTTATNNYGFYSNIASGSNRWNFFANGTADNYFAGNVGFGTTTPGTKLDAYSSSTTSTILRARNDTTTVYLDANNAYSYLNTFTNHPMLFGTNNTERMRITEGGEVYIAGTTDQGAYNLQCNGTGVWGAGAYVNGSDARLKDNIATLNDGLNVVNQLRPVTFKYKPDYSKDQNVQTGFIAQELQTALEGKDYLDGVVQAGPNHLNVAYQSLIPILTKAIQEQQAMIDELKAKVAALETK